jgi:hypothetical protein
MLAISGYYFKSDTESDIFVTKLGYIRFGSSQEIQIHTLLSLSNLRKKAPNEHFHFSININKILNISDLFSSSMPVITYTYNINEFYEEQQNITRDTKKKGKIRFK